MGHSSVSNSPLPATAAFAISTSDATPLPQIPRALYVGVTGNVAVRPVGSESDVTFIAVPAGTILPVRVSFVRATLTTATDIIGLA